MKPSLLVTFIVGFALLLAAAVGWRFYTTPADNSASGPRNADRVVPIAAADILQSTLQERRTFSGSLIPAATFRVAPHVGGRIERLFVDLADPVSNGAVVARLESAEYAQEVASAEADVAVARASLAESESDQTLTERSVERQTTLLDQGVVSDAEMDTARARQVAAGAAVQVAQAQVQRAEAELETARIRLGYTSVTAVWQEDDQHPGASRVVSQRMVQAGDTVAANAELLEIVALDPLIAVLHVDERAYAGLAPGQDVTLQFDAFPGRTFPATVTRVAPAFEAASRQARVELNVPNPAGDLKPGMFVRATAALRRLENATTVPEAAVVRRADQDAVFLLDDAGETVRLLPVETGLRDAGRVQIITDDPAPPTGRVVVLGQPLLRDGSRVKIIDHPTATSASAPEPAS